jgi:putative ABC transport system permease protein
VAANRSGLKVGDRIVPTHGIAGDDKHEESQFEVVGVLAPTGTANDRAVFINMEGFFLLEGHALTPEGEASSTRSLPAAAAPAGRHDDHHEAGQGGGPLSRHPDPLPESQRKVTSVLVLCSDMMASMAIEVAINRRGDGVVQAVAPRTVVDSLQSNFLTPVRLIFLVLTVLIVVVAGISILVSIYNSMNERSHDIAVMRALGASRRAVMAIILTESILLSLLGGLAGLALGHGVLAVAGPFVEFYTGITVRAWEFTTQELLLVPALVSFATLVGFLPALTAYRTDVAKTLGGGR